MSTARIGTAFLVPILGPLTVLACGSDDEDNRSSVAASGSPAGVAGGGDTTEDSGGTTTSGMTNGGSGGGTTGPDGTGSAETETGDTVTDSGGTAAGSGDAAPGSGGTIAGSGDAAPGIGGIHAAAGSPAGGSGGVPEDSTENGVAGNGMEAGASATSGGANSASGGASSNAVDCTAFTSSGYEVCSTSPDSCGVVFTNGDGCTVACAAAGLLCVSAAENLDDSCGPDLERPAVACDSGHESDYCLCGPGESTGAGGAEGNPGVGGAADSGGTGGSPGEAGAGGTPATAGAPGSGGTMATGGATSDGGTPDTGGNGAEGCAIPTDFEAPVGYAASVTGGGSAPAVEVSSMQGLVDALDAYDGSSGLVVRYTGVFDFSSIGDPCEQHSKTAQVVDIKDVSNVSIIGAPGSSISFGLHFVRATNIVVRNMTIGLVPGATDAIGIENDCSDFWLDHNELFSSMVECEGAGDLEFDGLLDIKDGSGNMTLSYNYFHDHHKVGLMGSSDSDTNDWRVTLHHNWYENVGSRLPLQRGGHTHLFNNFYTGVSVTGANIRMGGLSLIESNYFENCHNPVTSRDSESIGFWELRDNYLGSGITWSDGDEPFANAEDWTTTQAFGTVPYAYEPHDATCVKTIVMATAGARL